MSETSSARTPEQWTDNEAANAYVQACGDSDLIDDDVAVGRALLTLRAERDEALAAYDRIHTLWINALADRTAALTRCAVDANAAQTRIADLERALRELLDAYDRNGWVSGASGNARTALERSDTAESPSATPSIGPADLKEGA